MLNINEEEAVRDAVTRNSLLRRFDDFGDGYNTGASIVATNASEYISYCLAKGAADWARLTHAASYPGGGVFMSTGGAVVLVLEVKANSAAYVAPVPSPVLTPAEMLEAIRSAFMLNDSNAAEVLRVTRPTIYQWGALTDVAQIRAREDRERLQTLTRLAQAWRARGSLTGRWLVQPLPEGPTVLDLLSEAHIDEVALLAAHSTLRAAAPRLRKAEHVRAMEAAEALGSAFEKLAGNEQKRRKERI